MLSQNVKISPVYSIFHSLCKFKKISTTSSSSSTADGKQPHVRREELEKLLTEDSGENKDNEPQQPRINPKEMSVILFPGQGTQYVGMGKDLMKFPKARNIFQIANEILKYDLLKICFEGPREKLDRTEYAQLAVMVTSLAAVEQLQEERPKAVESCVATAGFSLGEITSLVFAGAIPFDKGLKLVQIRANAMQAACDNVAGGMCMVIFKPDSNIVKACSDATQWCVDKGIENPYCGVANYLYPHCKVIAGNVEALEFLEHNAQSYSIRRVKKLPVNGAFHTPLMQSAVQPFAKALKNMFISDPMIKVHSNVDGKAYKNASHIIHQLPKQIVRAVKWEQTMHHIYERKQGIDFPRTFECGPGRGLVQILEKVNASAGSTAYTIQA